MVSVELLEQSKPLVVLMGLSVVGKEPLVVGTELAEVGRGL